VIEGQDSVGDREFSIVKKMEINSSTFTFTFESIDKQPVDNLKFWYNDPAMIGRHFLVHSKEVPSVKRQYTICSSMNREVFEELMTLAWTTIQGKSKNFNYKMMLGQDLNWINLTLKTYGLPKGLATRIHAAKIPDPPKTLDEVATPGESFYIKGPMGRGLQLKPSG